jgi:hypothetical protein
MAPVYIAPTAQGSADGTSAANAYAYSSLSSAESDAGSGGTIYFTDGAYDFTTDVTWNADGVTYQSLNPLGAVLTRTGLSSGNNSGELEIAGTGNSIAPRVKNFKIVNMKVWFYQTSGLTGDNTPLLQGCDISSTTDLVTSTGLLRANFGTVGYPVRILNNSVHWKFGSSDTFLFTRLNDATVEGNSFYFDLGSVSGTIASSSSSFSSSKNNIFMSSDNAKMGSDSKAASSTNCCFYQFHSVNTSGGTNNIFEDPQFVDAPNANLRLRPTSPCIGAGTAS